MAQHLVVIQNDDGSATITPMKEWLRQHPEVLPTMNPNDLTSHQLRSQLRARGWSMQETPSEVRMIPPGTSSVAVEQIFGQEALSENDVGDTAYFSLEYQLRDFLASNVGTLAVNGKRLKVYVDQTGRDGVEYPTAVGPIDILAHDDSGAFYVFELKRAQSSDRAMGQLARYMGWISQTIARERTVFGIIVAKEISENLRYAAMVVPNVFLYEYEVAFSLKDANALGTMKR